MVARRDISPGEVVFTDQPAVIGPDNASLPMCLVCYKKVLGDYRSDNIDVEKSSLMSHDMYFHWISMYKRKFWILKLNFFLASTNKDIMNFQDLS